LLKQHYVFRSPDSALQSGLEQKPDFTPKGPQVWKGFVSMQDVAKFVTTAYRISGPSDKLVCFIKVFFYKQSKVLRERVFEFKIFSHNLTFHPKLVVDCLAFHVRLYFTVLSSIQKL